MSVEIHHGDCADVIKTILDQSIDSVVTDPPYALTSIVKRFGKAAVADDTKTGERSRAGSDGYARLAKGFMGKEWDNGAVAFTPEFWAEVLRVLKPGAHLVAFGGTRTYHRLACAIEDAGFEIRDQLGWLYGSGFPKSYDVSKGIDKAKGAERGKIRIDAANVRNPKATGAGRNGMEGATRPWIEKALKDGFYEAVSDEAVSDEAVSWQGWGTALKPAWEPIVLARKPLAGTVAANVLEYGTGALNIDASRIEYASEEDKAAAAAAAAQRLCQTGPGIYGGLAGTGIKTEAELSRSIASIAPTLKHMDKGRWPANIIHDGSEEATSGFPKTESQQNIVTSKPGAGLPSHTGLYGFNDSGSAARYFYSAKADAGDRLSSKHPTLKPVDLMAYLCRLITPPGGTILDPFAGSGTTGMACMRESFNAILIEREAEYVADIRRRLAHVSGEDTPLFAGLA